MAVSPQGRYVAASSSNGEVRLWDTSSSDHTGTIIRIEDEKSIAFSPDGKWLSIGARDETMLWGLNVEKFDSRRIPVGGSSMKFSPDGSLLAVRAKENTGEISVWNVHDSTLKEIVSSSSSPRGTVGLSSPPDVSWFSPDDFSFTSDGSRLVVSSSSSGVFVEPFDASWALGQVCRIVGRNLSPEERGKYLLVGSDYVAACPP
ncbi:MAG: WD40 repeat domain-containing protein [Pseudonocardiaceae bacterium]